MAEENTLNNGTINNSDNSLSNNIFAETNVSEQHLDELNDSNESGTSNISNVNEISPTMNATNGSENLSHSELPPLQNNTIGISGHP